MKKPFKALTASVLFFGSVLIAPAVPFITLGPDVKVVFSTVVVDGFSVTKATATISTTAGSTITVKQQTEVVVPDGSGFKRIVTQTTVVATLQGSGLFDKTTNVEVFTTPLNASQVPTGSAVVTDESPADEFGVSFADLDLPPSTEFFPFDGELDVPVVISPA